MEDFFEEWEKEYEIKREKNNQELTSFENSLLHDQGLTTATVDKHLRNLAFFAECYLLRMNADLSQITSDYIIDFLGDFYIRKVWDSSESNIPQLLTSFKKWANYLYDDGRLEQTEYEDIKNVCKQKEFFIHRYNQYFKSKTEEEMLHWSHSNDPEEFTLENELLMEEMSDHTSTISLDEALAQRWKEKGLGTPPIVTAFQNFLQLVKGSAPVRVTTSRQHFPRKLWLSFDEITRLNLFDKETLNQENIPLYQFFYHLALHLRHIYIQKGKAEVTAQMDSFLQYSDAEQAAILLDGLWNQISWADIQPSNVGGRPGISQDNRRNIAEALTSFPIDQELEKRSPEVQQLLYAELFIGGMDVFVLTILPILEKFGLVKLTYTKREGRKGQHYYDKSLQSLTVTRAGFTLFNYLKSQTPPKSKDNESDIFSDLFNNHDPFSLLLSQRPVKTATKVGRNAPCPCGSGKKYKKCCM